MGIGMTDELGIGMVLGIIQGNYFFQATVLVRHIGWYYLRFFVRNFIWTGGHSGLGSQLVLSVE
ncbi:hypothetical protein HNQ34_000420 [Anoxybacillus tepidamans]|uniref:Uncharacterized protein n=1 Tax=Anoxybacteroides tepidamans TaxID=265948 RepID=A0A7W8IMQ6_9BACL|nr:hypothetical protein [Anoxybacillus tepidamans]